MGAEGSRDNKPLLSRVRHPGVLIARSNFPHLLCIDLSYDVVDESELPSEKDYVRIEAFERLVLDSLEPAAGRYVFSDTGAGRIRYICYVREPHEAAALMAESAARADVQFSTRHDPSWTEYREKLSMLGLPNAEI